MSAPAGRRYETLITVSEPEGDITLNLREDRLKLRMSIVRGAKAEPPSLRSILTLLKERRVSRGVQQSAIQRALSEIEAPFSRIDDVLIAEGEAPVPGQDSHLISLLDDNEHGVDTDQAIAERREPTPGQPGTDVFGAPIPAKKGESRRLTAGSGVRQDGERFLATQPGFAAVTRDHVAVSERFDIHIDEDGFTARLTTQGDGAFDPRELLDHLGALGITHGLLKDDIKSVAERGQAHERVVAQANPPKPGRDAHLEYHFVRRDDPRLREDPEANPFAMFDPGTTLLTLTPAQPGQAGRDLFDREHPVTDVDRIEVSAGENVSCVEQDGKQLFQCTRRGAPFLRTLGDGRLQLDVHDQLKIPGDLTADYGHLRFEGVVQIGGNIPNGHSISVDADLHVKGVVNDAHVQVGGDLHLSSGFMGGHGDIAGDLHCKYIDNASLRVRGNIHVNNEIIGARIDCDGTIDAPKAVLRGGVASAMRGITLAEIGSDSRELRTDVHAGVDERLKQVQQRTDEQLAALNEEEKTGNARIHRILPDRSQIAMLGDKQREEVKQLLQRLSAIGSEREALKNALEQAREQSRAKVDGFVQVNRAVRPGTRLCIGHACSDISREIEGPVRLIERDGEIIIEPDS